MHKIRQTLCILGCSMLFASTAGALSQGFLDVADDHMYKESIEYVRTKEIVEGYKDGTYKPEFTINRAEFTKIIIGAQFAEEVIKDCLRVHGAETWTFFRFPDVPVESWYAPYVCMASENGIIGGYPDGTFKPEQSIRFVEAAKIIVKAFGYKVAENKETWYQPYVVKLEERGAIPVEIGTLEKTISRGEMAEMVYRLKTLTKNKPTLTYTWMAAQQQKGTQTLQSTALGVSYIPEKEEGILSDYVSKKVPALAMTIALQELTTEEEQTTLTTLLTTLAEKGIAVQLTLSFFPQQCTEEEGKECWTEGVWGLGTTFSSFVAPEVLAMMDQRFSFLWNEEKNPIQTIIIGGKETEEFLALYPEYIPGYVGLLNELKTKRHSGQKIGSTKTFDINQIEGSDVRITEASEHIALRFFPMYFGQETKGLEEAVFEWMDGVVNTMQGKSFGIIETMYPTQLPFGSEELQVAYIKALQTYLRAYAFDAEYIHWQSLSDRPEEEESYFRYGGLRNTKGEPRASYTLWFTHP